VGDVKGRVVVEGDGLESKQGKMCTLDVSLGGLSLAGRPAFVLTLVSSTIFKLNQTDESRRERNISARSPPGARPTFRIRNQWNSLNDTFTVKPELLEIGLEDEIVVRRSDCEEGEPGGNPAPAERKGKEKKGRAKACVGEGGWVGGEWRSRAARKERGEESEENGRE
jgi:hypothetical protein